MTKLRTIAALTFLVAGLGAALPAQAASRPEGVRTAQADLAISTPSCRYKLAEYTDYAKQLELFANKSRVLADQNPIYLSDVAYYEAELASTKDCIRSLTPFTSASR